MSSARDLTAEQLAHYNRLIDAGNFAEIRGMGVSNFQSFMRSAGYQQNQSGLYIRILRGHRNFIEGIRLLIDFGVSMNSREDPVTFKNYIVEKYYYPVGAAMDLSSRIDLTKAAIPEVKQLFDERYREYFNEQVNPSELSARATVASVQSQPAIGAAAFVALQEQRRSSSDLAAADYSLPVAGAAAASADSSPALAASGYRKGALGAAATYHREEVSGAAAAAAAPSSSAPETADRSASTTSSSSASAESVSQERPFSSWVSFPARLARSAISGAAYTRSQN